MADDHLTARVHRGLMLPRLIFGLPFTFAIISMLLTFEVTIVLHQYIVGAILFVLMYVLGRVASSRDVFFFDIVLSIFRVKGVLK